MLGFVNVSSNRTEPLIATAAPVRKGSGPPCMDPPPIISKPDIPPSLRAPDDPEAIAEASTKHLYIPPNPVAPALHDDPAYVAKILHGQPLQERAFDDANFVSNMGARLTDVGSEKYPLNKWTRSAPVYENYHTNIIAWKKKPKKNYPSEAWMFPDKKKEDKEDPEKKKEDKEDPEKGMADNSSTGTRVTDNIGSGVQESAKEKEEEETVVNLESMTFEQFVKLYALFMKMKKQATLSKAPL